MHGIGSRGLVTTFWNGGAGLMRWRDSEVDAALKRSLEWENPLLLKGLRRKSG